MSVDTELQQAYEEGREEGYREGQKLKANSISKYDRDASAQAARGLGLYVIGSDQRAVFNAMLGFVGETSKRLGL